MTVATAARRIVKFRVVNPNTGKIVGYERLMLTNDGTAWQYSIDDNEWEAGIFEGGEWTRDQATGVINDEDREMYENDIVARGTRTSIVSYDLGKFGMKDQGRTWAFPDGPSFFNLNTKLQIIGTIHANPELLEGGAKRRA